MQIAAFDQFWIETVIKFKCNDNAEISSSLVDSSA